MTIVTTVSSAQTPILISSGQIIYYYQAQDADGAYAVIVPPGTVSNYIPIVTPPEQTAFENPWEGYAKPGGNLVIPDTITIMDNPYSPIKIPVKKISREAFYRCTDITSIVIPNTVERIEQWAFCGCRNLKTITIGSDLDYIGTYTFLYCDSIDTVYYNAISATSTNERYTVPGTTDQSGIGNVFYVSDSAVLIISDSVFSIPAQMFVNCTFRDIIIGSSVTSIGDNNHFREPNAFAGTTIFKCPMPPLLGYGVRFGSNTNTCIVPCGSNTNYFTQWSNLFSEYATEPTDLELSVSSSNIQWGSTLVEQDVDCNGEAVIRAIPSYGYRFSYWNDGDSNNPRFLSITTDTQLIAYFDKPDTIFLNDTTYIDVFIHDTTTVIDTVTLTEYVPVHDTTYISIHDTTYITQTDTVTNTIYDTITNTLFDTITNTIHDTTVVYSTDTLWLHDTVFVHDTIYIHDTIVVGVDEVDAINAMIYTNNRQIVVDGAEGNTVWLYDVNGRILATKQDEYSPLRFNVPASGTYLVKIGNHPARKVVVIR